MVYLCYTYLYLFILILNIFIPISYQFIQTAYISKYILYLFLPILFLCGVVWGGVGWEWELGGGRMVLTGPRFCSHASGCVFLCVRLCFFHMRQAVLFSHVSGRVCFTCVRPCFFTCAWPPNHVKENSWYIYIYMYNISCITPV